MHGQEHYINTVYHSDAPIQNLADNGYKISANTNSRCDTQLSVLFYSQFSHHYHLRYWLL